MDVHQIPNMAEDITIPETSVVKNEVEEALPIDHKEPFDFPNHLLFPKKEDVPVGSICCFSGPCKPEPDTQELGSTCFDNEEVEEAFTSDHEEFFYFPTHLLSPKREEVPVGTSCCFSGPCKLEPDIKELGSTCFDNEEAEYASPIDFETIRETSNSTLSLEQQQLPLTIASRISNSTSVLDFQDLDCNDESIFKNLLHSIARSVDPVGGAFTSMKF